MTSESARRWNEAHREEINARNRKRRMARTDEQREQDAEARHTYYLAHKEQLAAKRKPRTPEQRARDNARERARYAANRERERERRNAHYAAAPEQMREQARAYRAAHREEILAKKRAAYWVRREEILEETLAERRAYDIWIQGVISDAVAIREAAERARKAQRDQ